MSRTAFREFIALEYPSLPKPTPPATSTVGNASDYLPLPPSEVPLPVPPATDRLPEFKTASAIVPAKVTLPELLIAGLLHRGCKLMLSGGSKSFKSWVLMAMGLCVSHGIPWWGLPTKKGRVLFLNFELIEPFFEERLLSICRALGVSPPSDFVYWTLRGHCYDLDVLAKTIMARLAEGEKWDLIIVDPLYKALGDLDENSASDMTKLMNLIEVITVKTGASVAFGSHFSKGNQAGKEAKDRPSGSGVLIRDPDAILVMTRHEEEHCYVVSSELRYLPPTSDFVVRWNFPIMQADESLDPRKLYQPGKAADEAAPVPNNILTEQGVLDCLPFGGAQDGLWRRLVSMKFNRSQEFYAIKAELLKKGHVVKNGVKYERVNLALRS